MTDPAPAPAAPVDAPADTPPIPEPVWSEYSRTITVQAYKVHDGGERIITIDGSADVGPDNYIVNDGGFLSVVAAEDFEALYPPQDTAAKK